MARWPRKSKLPLEQTIKDNGDGTMSVSWRKRVMIEQANRPDSLKALRADIRKVIDYNWSDEIADFETHEGDGEHHIFATLVRLDNWLRGTSFTPEQYVVVKEKQP